MEKKDFLGLLDEIRPKAEEQIERRIKHIQFAKIIIWGCMISSETDMICTIDLARYMRLSLQRARYILEDMVKFELLKKNKLSGCNVDYYFNIDSNGKPIIFKYFDLARNTLGIKLKLEEKIQNKKV